MVGIDIPREVMPMPDDKNNQRLEELKEVSMPLIEYLNKNYHQHVMVLVTPTSITVTLPSVVSKDKMG